MNLGMVLTWCLPKVLIEGSKQECKMHIHQHFDADYGPERMQQLIPLNTLLLELKHILTKDQYENDIKIP